VQDDVGGGQGGRARGDPEEHGGGQDRQTARPPAQGDADDAPGHYLSVLSRTASPTRRAKSTTRGPQREEMSASSRCTASFRTAVTVSKAGRSATARAAASSP